MAGYTESLTDPSYEGQILVLTYPLIGNYGVPKRTIQELNSLPEMFESSRIHVAALVVAYYSDHFSHFLANSSLGAWLKESRIPAMYGVDTRVLTKKIRENGSMLGKVLTKREDLPHPDDGNLALSQVRAQAQARERLLQLWGTSLGLKNMLMFHSSTRMSKIWWPEFQLPYLNFTFQLHHRLDCTLRLNETFGSSLSILE